MVGLGKPMDHKVARPSARQVTAVAKATYGYEDGTDRSRERALRKARVDIERAVFQNMRRAMARAATPPSVQHLH